ncbi:MAG: PKD domain-containing protein [Bacteroidota bacterium]
MRYFLIFIFFAFVFTSTNAQYWYVFDNDDTLNYSGSNMINIRCFYPDDSLLYVGGFFKYGGTTQLNCIATWDGSNWHPMDGGLSNTWDVYCVYKYNNKIYIGDLFPSVSYVPNTENIAAWDGNIWSGLNNSYGGLDGCANAMTVHNNKLIITGTIGQMGSIPFHCIAGYDENDFIYMGILPAQGHTVKSFNGELYVGGLWNSVRRYNSGTNLWEKVGGNTNYYVQDMVVDTFNNFLYVGGGFTRVDDSIYTDNVAIWDGFRWSKVGFGNNSLSSVLAIQYYRGELYAGLGGIDEIGGVFTGHLARWDGQNWNMVGDSVGWAIYDMTIFRDTLYVGGGVAYEPYDETRGIMAKWYLPYDSLNCNYLQPRVQAYEDTFDLVNDTAQVQFYNNNAYADSWSWDFGDTGTDNVKDPLHIYTDSGTFNVSVTVSHAYCTKTAENTIYVVDATGIGIPDIENLSFKLYPNPSDGNFYAEISETLFQSSFAPSLKGEKIEIKIIGLNGHHKTTIPVTSEKTLINTSGWAKGTYVCNLVIDGKMVRSEKMVLK